MALKQVVEETENLILSEIQDAESHLDLKYKFIRFLGLIDRELYWEVSEKDVWVRKDCRKIVKVVEGFRIQHISRKIKIKRIQEQSNTMDNVALQQELHKSQSKEGYCGLQDLLAMKNYLLKSYQTVIFICYLNKETVWYLGQNKGTGDYYSTNKTGRTRRLEEYELEDIKSLQTKYGNSEINTYVMTNGKYPLHQGVVESVSRKMRPLNRIRWRKTHVS
ncbi:hypothetical protein P9X10_00840 [Bacillus cereus]|nr:hypothetical protein [Bacillus cereus]